MASTSSFNANTSPLFRRCVQCPPDPPSCPPCADNEQCSLSAASCGACASTTCVKIGSIPGQAAPKRSTPIGGIVGGVIAGLAVVAALLWVYFYLRRKKRRTAAIDIWDPPEKRDQTTLSRTARQSTRSAHSIASTVLTRASNVIQIAYIPGVTVRSPPESPGLIPPVPSVPGAAGDNNAMEQHFFMPGDLRDSTWSDTSSIDPRISIAPSLARTSVAGTIYRNEAIVPPVPAQHAFSGKANVVSVKSGATTPSMSSTPSSRTPQIPQIPKMGNGRSSIVARNVQARPIEVKKVNSGTRVPTLGNLAKQAARKSATPSASEKEAVIFDEKEVVRSSGPVTPGSGGSESSPVSPITIPRPAFAGGHAATSSGISSVVPPDFQRNGTPGGPTHRHTNSGALNALIEDAINRARDPQHMGVTSQTSRPELVKMDSSPFSDKHEVKENMP